MKVGSYWNYEGYDLDKTGKRIDSTRYVDSVVVTGTETLYGKSCFKTVQYSALFGKALTKDYDYYQAYTTTQHFVNSGFLDIKEMLPIDLGISLPTDQWFTMADTKSASWNMLQEPIKVLNKKVNIGGVNFDISSCTITPNILRGATSTFTLNSKSYNAITYRVNIKVSFSVSSLPVPIDFNLYMENTYADGIGLVKMNMPSQSINLILLNYPVLGFEKTLTSYKR
jgi:hypothetical protein